MFTAILIAILSASIVEVSVPGGIGRGCVVSLDGEQAIVTAAHIVDREPITVRRGADTVRARVVSIDRDFAVLRLVERKPWCALPISRELRENDRAWLVLPRAFVLRRLSVVEDRLAFCDEPLRSGDSGSPVIVRGRVVGVVVGGWFWRADRTTWPCRIERVR